MGRLLVRDARTGRAPRQGARGRLRLRAVASVGFHGRTVAEAVVAPDIAAGRAAIPIRDGTKRPALDRERLAEDVAGDPHATRRLDIRRLARRAAVDHPTAAGQIVVLDHMPAALQQDRARLPMPVDRCGCAARSTARLARSPGCRRCARPATSRDRRSGSRSRARPERALECRRRCWRCDCGRRRRCPTPDRAHVARPLGRARQRRRPILRPQDMQRSGTGARQHAPIGCAADSHRHAAQYERPSSQRHPAGRRRLYSRSADAGRARQCRRILPRRRSVADTARPSRHGWRYQVAACQRWQGTATARGPT